MPADRPPPKALSSKELVDIELLASDVCREMKENKYSVDHDGYKVDPPRPWNPRREILHRSDPDLLELRLSDLRTKVFGVGMRLYLRALRDKGVIPGDTALKQLVTFATLALHNALMTRVRIKELCDADGTPVPNLTLTRNQAIMQYDTGSMPHPERSIISKMEKCHLVTKVKINDTRLDLHAGPIMKSFHKHIFRPVMEEFSKELHDVDKEKKDEQQKDRNRP